MIISKYKVLLSCRISGTLFQKCDITRGSKANRRYSQVVRQWIANPPSPSSNLGAAYLLKISHKKTKEKNEKKNIFSLKSLVKNFVFYTRQKKDKPSL